MTTPRSPYGEQPYAQAPSDRPAYSRLDYGHAPHGASQQQPYQQIPSQYQPSPQPPQYQPPAAAPEAKKRRKWPFVAGGIILLILIVSIADGVGGPGGTAASGASDQAARGGSAVAFAGSTSNDIVGNAGDTLAVGDLRITATPLKAGDPTLGETLCSTVTYVNTGSGQESFNGALDWKLQDPDGAALTTGFTGSRSMLSAGRLGPGGRTTGDMCFAGKAGAKGQYVLLFDPRSFSSGRGAWIMPRG
ncbi:DUF4352 domain-containing protein [Pseudonocardia sp.]|uniref:DUF4352 domain-containing protein n=1 Tax=Pseudonocardia sp. TaxID=60912 RepID=UPI0031FDA248